MTPVIKKLGIGNDCGDTFLTALAETDLGKAVALLTTPDHTVSLGADGDELLGVLEHVDEINNVGTVQLRGWVETLYSGSAPARGANIGLLLDGTGKVKAGASVKKYHVTKVVTATTKVTFWLG
jgi:hypothetical protein